MSIRVAMICLFLSSTTLGSCILANGDSSLTIYNDSDYAIVEINLSPVDGSSWGYNLLGSRWLYPGEDITIDYIDCDYYDVRVIDDTYLECIIYDLDLCFTDDAWTITNSFLNSCAFGY